MLPVKDIGTAVGIHIWQVQYCSQQLALSPDQTPTLTTPVGTGWPLALPHWSITHQFIIQYTTARLASKSPGPRLP